MKHNFSLINGVISTVCPYPYGSCGLIKKKKKKSVELPRTILDDVTRLIKRCHTVRSQFADELNQAALFSGLKDSAARDWHSRQRQCCFCTCIYIYATDTGTRFLLQLSNQMLCLCSFVSSLCFLPLSLSLQPPLLYSGTPVMASKGKVRGESVGCVSPCCASNSARQNYHNSDAEFTIFVFLFILQDNRLKLQVVCFYALLFCYLVPKQSRSNLFIWGSF